LLFSGFHQHLGELYHTFSWRRIRAVAWEYREYPFYVLPTSYLNVLAAQLPIFFLTSGFGATTVGLYAFSTTLLEMPMNLIGNAISPVFMQKATETFQREPARLAELCLSLYYKLFYIGLVPFGIITIFGDWIFRIAFGAKWEMAGLFTAYLGYYYMFKLASYATGPVYAVLQRQHLALLGTVLLVLARAASLLIAVRTHNLVVTFAVDMNILHLLRVNVWRVAARSIVLMALTLVVLWGLRLAIVNLFHI
jgi:O-antigen/teichoic acid export membrane protein